MEEDDYYDYDDYDDISNVSIYPEGCGLCQKNDDLRQGGTKAYSRCDIRDGKPCLPCIEYVQLEAKIEEAKAKLHRMLTRHQQIRTAINQTHDPILLRVPQEVASHILQFAIPNTWSGSFKRPDNENIFQSPLILGAVCKAWREIIWATPTLWTSIHVELASGDSFHRTKLKVFRQWFSRAGQLPLSVYLRIKPYSPSRDGEDEDSLLAYQFGPFFDILNNYSNRLQDLAIVCPHNLLSRFNGGSTGAPLLRRLALSIAPSNLSWGFDLGHPVKFSLTAGMPQPDCISLFECRLKDVNIYWNYVTTLTASSFTADDGDGRAEDDGSREEERMYSVIGQRYS